MSYDTKCEELARHFGVTDETLVADLAQDIQDCIEQWLSYQQPHNHTCQQCDKVVIRNCECKEGNHMMWCSSNCRAAFDL